MATDRNRDREFDPGLDTPKDHEPGTGQPVPGSPVWEDARSRADAIGATEPATSDDPMKGARTSVNPPADQSKSTSKSTSSAKSSDSK